MKHIKKLFKKLLLLFYKRKNIPEYTIQLVASITSALQASFIGNVYNIPVSVVFNEEESRSYNENRVPKIHLKYTIIINNYDFYFIIQHFKVSNKIELLSVGNGLIPLKKLVVLNSIFVTLCMNFEEKKDDILLPTLQDLPIQVS